MRDYSPLIEEWMAREALLYDEAAERLGVSSVIVRLWVRGKRTPSLRNQRTLERALGISSTLHESFDGLEKRVKKLEDSK